MNYQKKAKTTHISQRDVTADWPQSLLSFVIPMSVDIDRREFAKDRNLAPTVGTFTKESANLDFLRTIAVLCVFARHIFSEYGDPHGAWFQPQALGIFGVMAFFVHTSLVLMLSLERQTNQANAGAVYASFLVRRAFRVYPLSVAVVSLAWFILPPAMSHVQEIIQNNEFTWQTLVANLTLSNNLNGKPYVIGTLWTLPLELQMYLFLPLLFLLARRCTVATMLALWPLMVIAAYTSRYKLNAPEVLGYVPCFYAGVLAYRLGKKGQVRLPFWLLPLALIALLEFYMIGYGRIRSQTPLGWLVCLALGSLLPFLKPLRSGGAEHVCKIIAKYSYGIYLTHTFAIFVSYHLLGPLPEPLGIGVATVITAALSIASYHLLEAPGMALGANIAKRIDGARWPAKSEVPAP